MTDYSQFPPLSNGHLLTEDGCKFPIVRFALVKKSEYFQKLFFGHFRNHPKAEYLIPGISGETLGAVLSFVYTGSVDVEDSSVYDLLMAADYLLLDDLVKRIGNVDLTAANCMPMFLAASQIGRRDIAKRSFRFILTRFESLAAASDDGTSLLTQLPHQALERLVGHRSLCVRDEAVTLAAVRSWIEADVENRRQHHASLLLKVAAFDPKPLRFLQSAVQGKHDQSIALFKSRDDSTNLGCGQAGLRSTRDAVTQWMASSWTSSSIDTFEPRQSASSGFVETKRKPRHLYFVANFCKSVTTEKLHVYATYDEEIDRYRKLFDVDDWPDDFVAFGGNLYLAYSGRAYILRYSLEDRELRPVPMPITPRRDFAVAVLDGLLYLIGGCRGRLINSVMKVDACSGQNVQWHRVPSMRSVALPHAVAMGGKIYVVGQSRQASYMVAQSYSPETGAWALLPPPSVVRHRFRMVKHAGRIFVLGGTSDPVRKCYDLTDVEVFDPEQLKWFRRPSLPQCCCGLRTAELEGKLVVYEDSKSSGPGTTWVWDEEREDWTEGPPSLWGIHEHGFVLVDDEECVSLVTRDNRSPEAVFELTPFACSSI